MNNLPDSVTDEMYDSGIILCLKCDDPITEDEFADNDGLCQGCINDDE